MAPSRKPSGKEARVYPAEVAAAGRRFSTTSTGSGLNGLGPTTSVGSSLHTRARRMSDPSVKAMLSDVTNPHIARHCNSCREQCANAQPSEEIDCACHIFVEQEIHEDLLKAKISPFSLKFGSASLEQSFLQQSAGLLRWSVRGLLILLALNFFISGWVVLSEYQSNTSVFFLGVIVPCCLAGLVKTVLPRKIKFFAFRDSILFWLLMLIPGVILVIYSTRWRFETTSNAFTEYVFIAYVFRPFFREFCLLMALTQAGLLGANLGLGLVSGATFHLYVVRVLLPIFCAGFSLYGLELNVRHEFLLTEQLRIEDKRSERLLQRLVPARVVKMLKETGDDIIAERVQDCCIFFMDLVNFTGTSAKIAPSDVVEFLNAIFTSLDKLAAKHNVYKIETIGDAYFAASCNALSPSPVHLKEHMMRVVDFALEVRRAIPEMKFPFGTLNCRIGIHAGPVVAGVSSRLMPRYHFFGENVSIAELMEAHGVAGEIQVSARVRKVLGDAYHFSEAREVDLKQFGGAAEGFLVTGKNEAYDPARDSHVAEWDAPEEEEPLAPRAGTLAAFSVPASPASPAAPHPHHVPVKTSRRTNSKDHAAAAAAALGDPTAAAAAGRGIAGLESHFAPPASMAVLDSGTGFARRPTAIRRTLGDKLRQHFVAPGSVPLVRRAANSVTQGGEGVLNPFYRGGSTGLTSGLTSAAPSRPVSRGGRHGLAPASVGVHSGLVVEALRSISASPQAGPRPADEAAKLDGQQDGAATRRARRRVQSRATSWAAGAPTSRPPSAPSGDEGHATARSERQQQQQQQHGAGVAVSAKPSMSSQVSAAEGSRGAPQSRLVALADLVGAGQHAAGMPISLLSLRFIDETRPDMEGRFQETFLRTCLHHSRVLVLFLFVLNVISPGIDYGATESLSNAPFPHRVSLFVVRFGFMLPEAVLFLLLATWKRTQRGMQHPAIAWLVTLTHAAGFLALCKAFDNQIACTSCRLYLYAALVVRMPFLWYVGFTACNVAIWCAGTYYWAPTLGDGSASNSSWPLFMIQRLIFLYIMYQQEWSDRKLFYMKALLAEEEAATEHLLDSMLPRRIAAELKAGRQHTTEYVSEATVLFCDIPALHKIRDATELVSILHLIFAAFDRIVQQSGVYKVETIGDVYMVCCGGNLGSAEAVGEHARVLSGVAVRLRDAFIDLMDQIGDEELECRIGLNSGPLIAGVIGIALPRLRLFGDTVNTASRMCTNCESGDIQVSEAVHQRIQGAFECEPRGAIPIKGKGHLNTYYLRGPLVSSPPASQLLEAARPAAPALSLAAAAGLRPHRAPPVVAPSLQVSAAAAEETPQSPLPASPLPELYSAAAAAAAAAVLAGPGPAGFSPKKGDDRRASLQSVSETELGAGEEEAFPLSYPKTSRSTTAASGGGTASARRSAHLPLELERMEGPPPVPGIPLATPESA